MQHCACLPAEGASGQSKGGPEPLGETTSVSLCLAFGGSRCRNYLNRQQKASAACLQHSVFASQAMQPPKQEKSGLVIMRLSTNMICLF